jgi:hypothetical protein
MNGQSRLWGSLMSMLKSSMWMDSCILPCRHRVSLIWRRCGPLAVDVAFSSYLFNLLFVLGWG